MPKGQQPKLKSEHVTHLRLPLPPLAEQAAIVERVEDWK
jgi:restriction endonuclease S subunit